MQNVTYLYPGADLGLPNAFFELKRQVTSIGRHPNNDISLLLDSISRFHAQVEMRGNIWMVTDLNSSNGTFLNGDRITTARPINEGDVLTLGRADFVFSFFSPSERRSAPADAAVKTRKTDVITTGVNLVGEEESSSIILSTQFNIESTPLPGLGLAGGADIDLAALTKANERLLTLYRLAEIIRESQGLDAMFANVMDMLFDTMSADRGAIMTVDRVDGTLEPRHVKIRGRGNEGFAISKTIVQKCLSEKVAILSRDAKLDSRFSASESIVANEIRSAMCVPLVSKNTLLGILFVDTNELIHAFNEDDLAYLTSVANDLAITVDNLTLAEENLKNERLAAVGQTIAGLAHNIKNILQLAKGGIELMDTAIARQSMEEVQVYWPVVRRGIDRMQSLTQEMLAYSRQTRPELLEFSVNEVIRETIDAFQKDSVEPGVEITVELQPDIPLRRIDPDGLLKSLMNLIGNAVDAFEGGGGKIAISSRHDKDTIYIHVSDNGRGIPKDKVKKIFQPFFTTKGSKGTGLGLSMTRKYIEDMGGELSVQSEEGFGTTFTITLPPFTTRIGRDVDELPGSTQA